MATLIKTLKSEEGVGRIAVSPDSTRVAASSGSDIRIWDVRTGRDMFGAIKGHSGRVRSVSFSPDGRTLASGSADHTVRLWNSETGSSALEPLIGHTDWISRVTFSYDGSRIISGSVDNTIRWWDAHTGEPIGQPIRDAPQAWSIITLPDGRTIAASSGYGSVPLKVYDASTGVILFEFANRIDQITEIEFSPDGGRVAAGFGYHADSIGTVHIWDIKTGQAIGIPLRGHDKGVWSIAFSPDSRYIAASAGDYTIRIWDAYTGALSVGPLPTEHAKNIEVLAFSVDGSWLFSGSSDHTIKVWDVRSLGIQTQNTRTPAEDEITGISTISEIVSSLDRRGCVDMTDLLDLTTCSEYPISSGGFGDIFRCRIINGTEVAIKTLRQHAGDSEQNQKRLKHTARELYTWAQCHHPNVQPLLGLVVFRNQIGMIAEWESNGSMPQYLEKQPDVDRCILCTQIAEGLSYLHVNGMVHGDLKGSNVLISKDGVAQLSDFGNASLQEYTLQFTKTSTKETLSSRWAAPELFEGGACSVAADIYALGMTVLEAITGDVPWSGQSERAVIFAVMVDKTHPERPEVHIPRYSEHGDTLWALLWWCWEDEPEKRPTAEKVKTMMKDITQEGLKSREVEMDDAGNV